MKKSLAVATLLLVQSAMAGWYTNPPKLSQPVLHQQCF